MRACGRKCWLGFVGAFLLVIAGAAFWVFFTKPTPTRVSRSFSTAGVKKVILRAAAANTSDVTTDPATDSVEISGVTAGGAEGYHPGNPFWRETPAAKWGLDFVSARFGDVLLICTKNEIEYIHHHYLEVVEDAGSARSRSRAGASDANRGWSAGSDGAGAVSR